MGKLPGHRQVTLYADEELYERVRCTAYFLGEDIYEFVHEAFKSAVTRRVTKAEAETLERMAKQNIKNGSTRVRRVRRPAL